MIVSPEIKTNFEKIIPLPRALQVPLVGIDVSDDSIKFLEIKNKKGVLAVGSWGEERIPEGTVINGEIKDRRALVLALQTIQKKANIKFANASLPEEKAFLFKVNVPKASDEAVRTNLSFQLEKKVPVALSEAVFDYDFLASPKKTTQAEAVVTVFPADFVNGYVGVFKEAGITPLSLEIEAQAIARAVVPKDRRATSMVVDFGHKRTGLSVVARGAVVYTSTLEVGGDIISQKIKDTLNVSDDEVIKIKNEIGFAMRGRPEIYEAVSGAVLALKDEINKHYSYWNGRADEGQEEPIEKIFLCGGNSNVAGVKEYLSESLGIPVVRGNVWQNAFSFDDYIPPINDKKAASFATAIGLALGGL